MNGRAVGPQKRTMAPAHASQRDPWRHKPPAAGAATQTLPHRQMPGGARTRVQPRGSPFPATHCRGRRAGELIGKAGSGRRIRAHHQSILLLLLQSFRLSRSLEVRARAASFRRRDASSDNWWSFAAQIAMRLLWRCFLSRATCRGLAYFSLSQDHSGIAARMLYPFSVSVESGGSAVSGHIRKRCSPIRRRSAESERRNSAT
jgi:hypothetical protein